MKEIKFEIPVPAFLGTQKTKDWFKIGLSILWLAITIFIGINYTFSFVEILILAYFGLALIWKLDSRISASLALLFLVATPILLILKNDVLAETLAIYVYYFLIITVIQSVFELKNDQETTKGPVPSTNFALASSPSTRGAGAKLVRGVDNSTRHPKRKIV